jgi:uncharacterized protein
VKWARRIAVLPIRFYRRFISPLKPPTCRFHPTCSVYTAQAILAHGIVKGSLLATWRILRCQPFGTEGFDPVPPPGRWRPVPPPPPPPPTGPEDPTEDPPESDASPDL